MTGERARLFVALELPASVREELVAWRGGVLAGVPGMRPHQPSAESLHVTLCFLGTQAVADIDAIGAACGVAGRFPAIALRAGEPLWLPPRRPRVLALGVSDAGGVLAQVQSAVSAALVDGGWFEPEGRPFLAHVTLARTAREGLRRPPQLPAAPELAFTGSTVALMRSHTGSAGARYERVIGVELVESGRAG